jgi:hypothetical protein
MLGEFEFATYDLWRALWLKSAPGKERSRRFQEALGKQGLRDAADSVAMEIAGASQEDERRRIGAIVRDALADLYGLDRDEDRYWGFKEIWIGTNPRHDWEPFDSLFPEAFYVHLVRHPLEFARSAANWTRQPLTLDALRSFLHDWMTYLHKNQERAGTGRYLIVKYEDLVAYPNRVMTEILGRLDLALEPQCLVPLETLHLPSAGRSGWPQGTRATLTSIRGLEPVMAELGYREPMFDDSPPVPIASTLVAVRQHGSRRWQLVPPFMPDHGAWRAPLFLEPQLAPLLSLADDVSNPRRSPLRLFEDQLPLGPPHSLHSRIREEGQGRYSHWQGNILNFSTSDNSDPNTNGRSYQIEWDVFDDEANA